MADSTPAAATPAPIPATAPAGTTVPLPQVPGGAPQQTLAGTNIPLAQGTGVERLVPINAPFRTNAPPWYTPPGTVWGQVGCAVPQPGRYLQTNNGIIYDFTTMVGRALFDVLWKYPDRKFDRFPTRDCLWEIHQLLVIARNRLVSKTTAPGTSPLLPTHITPAPKMFVVFPIPLYGPLGCPNQYLREFGEMGLMMAAEAMQHADNELSFFVTKEFFGTVYGYIKYLLIDLATKFFGIDIKTASDDAFVIPDASWTAYNPAQFSVSFEGTSSRPPMGMTPTDLDLEPIRGIPIEQVIPFLQPWPDSQLKYSTGGIWAADPSLPNAGSGVAASAAAGAAANPTIFTQPGPPSS